MRKSFTAGVLVVGMALGSVLTMALNPVGAASALVGAAAPPGGGGHQNVLQQALNTLVGNGTITQNQANAVTNQVHQNLSQRMAKLPRLSTGALKEVAFLLKANPKDLVSELRTGKTIADVAKEKGVELSAIASSLQTTYTNAINKRVSAGKLKQEWATTMEQNLPSRINAFLNRTWGHGRRGAHANATPPSSAPSTTAPATTAPPTTAPPSSTSSTAPASPTTTG
jgi:hypothetical protein